MAADGLLSVTTGSDPQNLLKSQKPLRATDKLPLPSCTNGGQHDEVVMRSTVGSALLAQSGGELF